MWQTQVYISLLEFHFSLVVHVKLQSKIEFPTYFLYSFKQYIHLCTTVALPSFQCACCFQTSFIFSCKIRTFNFSKLNVICKAFTCVQSSCVIAVSYSETCFEYDPSWPQYSAILKTTEQIYTNKMSK